MSKLASRLPQTHFSEDSLKIKKKTGAGNFQAAFLEYFFD